ncbi:MAG: super-infection exclusion protein B [Paraclostridium sp.]
MNFIDTIIGKFKIKELAAICFFSSLILILLPVDILEFLALLEFRDLNKTKISLVLIATSSYYLFSFIRILNIIILKKMFPDDKKAIKYMKNYMSEDEMFLIIDTFYDNANNIFRSTGYINFSEGRKAALESKKIIYLSSQISRFDEFAYSLQPYARRFLNKNLEKGNIKVENNRISYYLE